jgi:hypothetical protein
MRAAANLTSECSSGAHSRCWHRNTSARGLPRRVPGGFTIQLCACDCHASCPLTTTAPVSDRAWEASCTCPGAEQVRRISGHRHVDSERVRAAADAVRARAEGKGRAEIRAMLLAELGPRPRPGAGGLDAEVDRIARYWEHTAAGRAGAVRGLAVRAGDLKRIAQLVRQGLKNNVSDPSGREACFVPQDSAARGLEVILDAAGERVLEDMAKNPWDGGQQRRPAEVPVWLGAASPPRPGPVTVHVGRRRLGELRPGDAALVERDLQRARQQDKTLWMCGRHIPPTAPAGPRLLLYPGVPLLLTFPFPPGPGAARPRG